MRSRHEVERAHRVASPASGRQRARHARRAPVDGLAVVRAHRALWTLASGLGSGAGVYSAGVQNTRGRFVRGSGHLLASTLNYAIRGFVT